MLHLTNNIKKIRELASKTQYDFAAILGVKDKKGKVSKDKYYTYESGITEPTPLFLETLANLAGVSVEDLKNKKLTREDIQFNKQPDVIATDGKNIFVAEVKSMPAGFDKNQFIELLQRHIEVMQKNNEVLLRILDEKITAQETNLNEIRSNQAGVIMLLKEALTRAASYRYGAEDKKKLDNELHEINKIVAGVLK